MYAAQHLGNSDDWPWVSARLQDMAAEARSAIHPSWSATRRLRWLVDFLQDRLFRFYTEDQSTIEGVFREYRYNCVTSSLVFLTLAQALNLPVRVLHRSAHVFCLVDVSSTQTYAVDYGWVEPLFPYVGQEGEKVVGPGRLVGLLAQNLIITAQDRGDWQTCLRLAVDRWHLEGEERDREAFYKTLHNVLVRLLLLNRKTDARILALKVQREYGAHHLLDAALAHPGPY